MTIADKLTKKTTIVTSIILLILSAIVATAILETIGVGILAATGVGVPLLIIADFVGEFFKEKEPRLPWHEVEAWEVDVCKKWGGRTQAEQGETAQTLQYGDMTATVQARKTKSLNETLYEITYFIETYSITTNYAIKLVNKKTGASHTVTTGNLEPGSGATELWARYLPEDYTEVTIEYAKGRLSAPIIEVR